MPRLFGFCTHCTARSSDRDMSSHGVHGQLRRTGRFTAVRVEHVGVARSGSRRHVRVVRAHPVLMSADDALELIRLMY